MFLRIPGTTGSRFGAAPVSGEQVVFDGGGIDKLEFLRVGDLPLSTKSFAANAFEIANPVKDQLVIKGATSDVKQVSLYSVLGNQVLSTGVSNAGGNIEIDVNSLAAGIYILDITGENGERHTEKIIKQ